MRIKLLFVGYLLFFGLLLVRLFYWQVVKADELRLQAKRQYEGGNTQYGQRGRILSNDGSVLVGNTRKWLLFAELKKIVASKADLAEKLASIFVSPDEYEETSQYKQAINTERLRLHDILTRDDLVWVALKNKISEDQKKSIEALETQGLGFEEQSERFYTEASSAAHLLGFVGKDKEGNDM